MIALSESAKTEFACEVRAGLARSGQKELHSKYLYDELGSALFEAITVLPEYGLTRADERLLRKYAHTVPGRFESPLMVAELGSGSGRKTRPVLSSIAASQPEVHYYPIDVSRAALDVCAHELEGVALVHPIEDSYLDGMQELLQHRPKDRNLLVLFLGSTIGNFERTRGVDFLSQLRRLLAPGDALLLGADLVKPVPQMLLAYDDPIGLTAAFNLNLLGRINRELNANFDLNSFRHEVRWSTEERRIEMHLRSVLDQIVTIRDAKLIVILRAGETIWTESSHKFHRSELNDLAQRTGFRSDAQWVDDEWPFAENLWVV